MENLYDVIIIGSGPAGLSAAIYAKRAKLSSLTIEANFASGGQDNFSCIVNGRLHGRQLDQNLSAVPAFLYHPLDRLHVSDRAGEAV